VGIGSALAISAGAVGLPFGTPGASSTASVSILDGATFETGFAIVGVTGFGDANTGDESVSSTVVVDGAGSTWISDSIRIAFNDPSPTSTAPEVVGTVIVSNGGLIDSDIFVGDGGALVGNGTVDGTIFNDGGIVRPGLSPGTLTVGGDFIMSSGRLAIEVTGLGLGQFDMLNIGGAADIFGGEIFFDFGDFLRLAIRLVFSTLVTASRFQTSSHLVSVALRRGLRSTSTEARGRSRRGAMVYQSPSPERSICYAQVF
jgi:hypothetical protein